MGPLRLAYMGSPAFAVPALQALHAAGHHIAAVYSQPPRPAGRGNRLTPCPVHGAAEQLGLAVRTPARLRGNADVQADFAALDLDAAVVAAYGLILPSAMLAAPRRGCLNIHASLLPRWRGAAPIQAAILAGDDQTGITVMQMDAGLDTGPMLRSGTVPIGPQTTTPVLHDALALMGATLVLEALRSPPVPIPQPEHGATYAPKLTRADGQIEWAHDAAALDRRIRAMNPWPGTFTTGPGGTLKILAADPVDGNGLPGTVLAAGVDAGLLIACGRGALRVTRVQAPGRAAQDSAAFLRGTPIPPGTTFGPAA